MASGADMDREENHHPIEARHKRVEIEGRKQIIGKLFISQPNVFDDPMELVS
jgi:hypothetical protein